MKEGNKRSEEINASNKKTNRQKESLRPYRCEKCNKIHLTKMSNHRFKLKTDIRYRVKTREENFIRNESEYHEIKFGIQQ